MDSILITKNRKALFNNELLEKFSAGIVLKGYEVKAIREGQANLESSYVQVIEDEPFVVNMYIGKYSKQSLGFSETDERRNRKLLLNKGEIEKVKRGTAEKGRTAVPLALILQGGKLKLEFAVVKGKKEFEKKVVAKDRQIAKDLAREAKELRN